VEEAVAAEGLEEEALGAVEVATGTEVAVVPEARRSEAMEVEVAEAGTEEGAAGVMAAVASAGAEMEAVALEAAAQEAVATEAEGLAMVAEERAVVAREVEA
jgi:hypothetical protein